MAAKETKNKSFLRRVYVYLRGLLALVGLFFIIFHLFFEVQVVISDSMSPTLQGNDNLRDIVLVEKFSYLLRKPQRWEIVKFHTQDELKLTVMKRIVGLPGENVSINDNWVFINGEAVTKPEKLAFLDYFAVGNLYTGKVMQCDGGYCVLGDDSKDSYDSRFTGVLKSEDIEGKAFMIIWPLSRFGFVK